MPDSVQVSWNRIVAWLQLNAPSLVNQINKPASIKELDKFQGQLGIELPADFCEFYKLVNGAEYVGIFLADNNLTFDPMTLKEIYRTRRDLNGLLKTGDFDDGEPQSAQGIADVWWNTNWIPFGENGGGDYCCIDLAPTDQGHVGQVITHDHETGQHFLLAHSLTDYLSRCADLLESNAYEYDEEYGIQKI